MRQADMLPCRIVQRGRFSISHFAEFEVPIGVEVGPCAPPSGADTAGTGSARAFDKPQGARAIIASKGAIWLMLGLPTVLSHPVFAELSPMSMRSIYI
jgi:hypothetical protein